MKLTFEIEGGQWPLHCDTSKAPRTLAALARNLPQDLQLHTPKIAGSHIYWHAPFVESLEGGTDVLDAQPGAFIYWPVRQFLEITFAPLQAETASVTVLGHLEGPVDGIVALGEQLRQGHGKKLFAGTLALAAAANVPVSERPRASQAPAHIVEERKKLWAACPAEMRKLVNSRAIMHPAGPVFMAESESRVLHETLWWIRERIGSEDEVMLRNFAALACNKAAVRLRDFCHLGSSADLIFTLEQAFPDEMIPIELLVEEAILISGRLGAWLDLLIPWFDINESFRAALSARPEAEHAAVKPLGVCDDLKPVS